VLQEEREERIKSEKMKIALEKMKEARIQKVRGHKRRFVT